MITSDSFQGLRMLVMPQKILHRRSNRYPAHDPMARGSRTTIHYLQDFDTEHQWQLRWALMRKQDASAQRNRRTDRRHEKS